jgi:hypothetical protein
MESSLYYNLIRFLVYEFEARKKKTIQKIHGPTAQNKHGAHYAGLIESDER